MSCGRTMGHGEACNDGHECDSCLEIIQLKAEIKKLKGNLGLMRSCKDISMSLNDKQSQKIKELKDFAIWMTGCGYDFTQHDYFIEQRDKLLKE